MSSAFCRSIANHDRPALSSHIRTYKHACLSDGSIANQETLDRLADISVAYAQAGAQCIAPSDMMDGEKRASGRDSRRREREFHVYAPSAMMGCEKAETERAYTRRHRIVLI